MEHPFSTVCRSPYVWKIVAMWHPSPACQSSSKWHCDRAKCVSQSWVKDCGCWLIYHGEAVGEGHRTCCFCFCCCPVWSGLLLWCRQPQTGLPLLLNPDNPSAAVKNTSSKNAIFTLIIFSGLLHSRFIIQMHGLLLFQYKHWLFRLTNINV